MNTQIHIKEDGKQIMELYTYTDSKGINELRRHNLEPLLYNDCYDSPEESKIWAKGSGLDMNKLTFLTVYVNMSNTVFDKLDSVDLASLNKFYEAYQSDIAAFHKNPSNTAKKLSLEMCAIYSLKGTAKFSNVGVVRGIKRRRNNTQYSGLSCLNTPSILIYNLIDTRVIVGYKFI